MTDQQIEDVIVNGRGKMPANKKLDEEQLSAITKYLHELAARDTASEKTHAVEKLYREKCAGCHAQDGAGNVALGRNLKVPNLTSAAVTNQSDQQLADVIAKGKGKMPGFARSCTPAQVKDVAAYVKLLPMKKTAQTKASESKRGVEADKSSKPSAARSAANSAVQPSATTNQSGETRKAKAAGNADVPQTSSKTESKPSAAANAAPPKATRGKPTGIQQTYVAKCAACHSSDGSGQGMIGRSMKIRGFSSPEIQGKSDEELARVISSGRGKMPAYAGKLTSEQIFQLVAYIRALGKK
jgi:cytochrome c6